MALTRTEPKASHDRASEAAVATRRYRPYQPADEYCRRRAVIVVIMAMGLSPRPAVSLPLYARFPFISPTLAPMPTARLRRLR